MALFTRLHRDALSTKHKIPLGKRSARCRDLYLNTHNPQYRQTSMAPARFEPAVLPSERQQTLALDRAYLQCVNNGDDTEILYYRLIEQPKLLYTEVTLRYFALLSYSRKKTIPSLQ
jgi:hypothetical protein